MEDISSEEAYVSVSYDEPSTSSGIYAKKRPRKKNISKPVFEGEISEEGSIAVKSQMAT